MSRVWVVAAAMLATAAMADVAPPRGAKKAVLSVGLVAALSEEGGKAQGAAMAAWVRSTLGREAAARVFTDYEALATALEKDEVQLGFMGPLAWLRVDEKAGAQLIARSIRKGHSTYRSVLIAKVTSPLKSVESLRKAKNLKVLWVDPSSATGYLVPKAMLLKNGIDPVQVFVTQDFATSHEKVCEGVFSGKWDLGATFSDDPRLTVAKATACTKPLGDRAKALRVVATTEAIPNDVLVASRGVSATDVQKLSDAAMALAKSEAGKKVTAEAFLSEGFDLVTDADFAPVRRSLDTFKK